jgi:hypothetical protein
MAMAVSMSPGVLAQVIRTNGSRSFWEQCNNEPTSAHLPQSQKAGTAEKDSLECHYKKAGGKT